MSAIETENLIDVRASDDADTHEFRPLSEEEKQHFVSFAGNCALPVVEEKADLSTNSIEENEGSASRELLLVPPAEQPLVPLMEPLEFRSSQVATSLYRQDRSVMLQFVFPLFVSVIAFVLVLNYPIDTHQTDQ